MATVYYTATSLDGFLATTDHSLTWLFEVEHGPEVEESFGSFMPGVGAQVMGSSTYEWLLRHESFESEPETWNQSMGRPTFVLTTRSLPPVPGADITFTQAPVAEIHAAAVAAAGDGDVWLMGGGDVVGQFADAGLLDRIVVSIAPVTLGAGAPLLPREIRSDRLTLVEARPMGQFAALTYDVGPLR